MRKLGIAVKIGFPGLNPDLKLVQLGKLATCFGD